MAVCKETEQWFRSLRQTSSSHQKRVEQRVSSRSVESLPELCTNEGGLHAELASDNNHRRRKAKMQQIISALTEQKHYQQAILARRRHRARSVECFLRQPVRHLDIAKLPESAAKAETKEYPDEVRCTSQVCCDNSSSLSAHRTDSNRPRCRVVRFVDELPDNEPTAKRLVERTQKVEARQASEVQDHGKCQKAHAMCCCSETKPAVGFQHYEASASKNRGSFSCADPWHALSCYQHPQANCHSSNGLKSHITPCISCSQNHHNKISSTQEENNENHASPSQIECRESSQSNLVMIGKQITPSCREQPRGQACVKNGPNSEERTEQAHTLTDQNVLSKMKKRHAGYEHLYTNKCNEDTNQNEADFTCSEYPSVMALHQPKAADEQELSADSNKESNVCDKTLTCNDVGDTKINKKLGKPTAFYVDLSDGGQRGAIPLGFAKFQYRGNKTLLLRAMNSRVAQDMSSLPTISPHSLPQVSNDYVSHEENVVEARGACSFSCKQATNEESGDRFKLHSRNYLVKRPTTSNSKSRTPLSADIEHRRHDKCSDVQRWLDKNAVEKHGVGLADNNERQFQQLHSSSIPFTEKRSIFAPRNTTHLQDQSHENSLPYLDLTRKTGASTCDVKAHSCGCECAEKEKIDQSSQLNQHCPPSNIRQCSCAKAAENWSKKHMPYQIQNEKDLIDARKDGRNLSFYHHDTCQSYKNSVNGRISSRPDIHVSLSINTNWQ